MDIYLPIAETPVNVLLVLAMGAAVGFVSGMFGVGGGFLLTPLLIFVGISPAVAVATVTPQIIASSTSGALNYWRRDAIDFKLAALLFLSGAVGAVLGASLFAVLARTGQLNVVISLSYTLFLGAVGALMVWESGRAIWRARAVARGAAEPLPSAARDRRTFVDRLPLKVRFRRSKLYMSVLPVLALGLAIAFLGALLGIGGGFIMVPALIYLLRVPVSVVVGTSLTQIIGSMAVATVMHAVATGTVDAVLALILMIGGVLGAQFGASIGFRMRSDYLRALLGVLVLAVGVRFAVGLVVAPDNPFSINVVRPIPG